MKNVAFIPVRGGSKSIPLKNIKLLNGKPLVYWTMRAACDCQYVNKVYVATDSEKIVHAIQSLIQEEPAVLEKVTVIGRSSENASDTASTESVLLEFATEHDFENVVLIQATSPLLRSKDLDSGFETMEMSGTDSVMSAVLQKRLNWKYDDEKFIHPLNYDYLHRPRRQDFKGYLTENGAFYITSRNNLLKSGCRISGSIRAVEMCEESFYEIDEPADFELVEALLQRQIERESMR